MCKMSVSNLNYNKFEYFVDLILVMGVTENDGVLFLPCLPIQVLPFVPLCFVSFTACGEDGVIFSNYYQVLPVLGHWFIVFWLFFLLCSNRLNIINSPSNF